MSLKQLQSLEELEQFIQQPGKRLLFKHSTSCNVSADAYAQFQSYLAEENIEAAVVYVLEQRPISNHIAEAFQIKHESPQIFLLEEGNVLWHTSHWRITNESIQEAVQK